MKTTLCLILTSLLLLPSCNLTLPPTGGIQIPFAGVGIAGVARDTVPVPLTEISFETEGEELGSDKVRIDFTKRKVRVRIADDKFPPYDEGSAPD